MKRRRITLSIALALSIALVALTSFDSKAQTQNQIRVVADTGIITLGPNQMLRMAVMKDGSNNMTLENYAFRRIEYAPGICSGGVCKQTIASQNISDTITLMTGEAASTDITPLPNSSAVRVVVLSNNPNPRINALIIDTVTGQVDSLLLDVILHPS